jgi:hypothetical protein
MTTQEILGSLGLSETNSGVFAGAWIEGTGDTIEVINPTTAEPIASPPLLLR